MLKRTVNPKRLWKGKIITSMNPQRSQWWEITLSQGSLKHFHSVTAQALHHFSYKPNHITVVFLCCWEGKKDIIIFMRAQGTLNKYGRKGNTSRDREQKSYRKTAQPEDLTSRWFCSHQITIHRRVVLGQSFQLWEAMPPPLAPGDITHSCQDTQLAWEVFQNLTGSKIASKQVLI